MTKWLMMLAVIGGCASEPMGDDLMTSVCDPTVASCHAALVVAEANCSYKIACDDEYTVGLQDCIDWTMAAICRDFDCEATAYERTETVEACAAEYKATGCHEIQTACSL